MLDAWSYGCHSSFLNTFPWKEPPHARTPEPRPAPSVSLGAAVLWTLLCERSQAVPAQIMAIVNDGKMCPDVRRVQRLAALWHVKLRCPSSMELWGGKPRRGHRKRAWMGLPRPAPVWFPNHPLWKAARQAHPSSSPLLKMVCTMPRFEGQERLEHASGAEGSRKAPRHPLTVPIGAQGYASPPSPSCPFLCPGPQPWSLPWEWQCFTSPDGIMKV